MKTLLKNARILKMDDTPLFLSNLVVDGNLIAYIGDDYEKYGPFDIVRDCNGNVIMPGFKNAHSHNAMSFLRSKADDAPLHDWLFNIVFPREDLLQPEDLFDLVKVSILECLTSGITSCLDMYYYPLFTAKAAEQMGYRMCLSNCFNAAYCIDEHIVKYYYRYKDKKDSIVRFAPALHAEYTADEQTIESIINVTKECKTPLNVHLAETASEVEECKKRRNGMTPAEFLDSLGLFKYGGTCFHCIYLSDHDIEIFKKHKVYVVTCPGSNTKLASGIAPIKKYMESGLKIAIGTDGPASNNCLDMFKEMSLLYSLQKVSTFDSTALPAYEILKMATVNGARAMGLDNADTLEVGKLADIIEIDLSRPNMQPLNNIVDNIVYAGSKDNIKMTMIDGVMRYVDRQFNVNQSIEEIYAKCQAVTERIDREIKKK